MQAGSWSVFTVVFTVIMVLDSLVLMVVLLVMAMQGRFRSWYSPEELPEPPPAEQAAEADAEAEPGAQTAPPAKPAPRPRRKTGLWQLIAALCACIPAVMVSAWVDNTYGQYTAFSLGAGLNLVLLAGQVFLVVWMIVLQKKL